MSLLLLFSSPASRMLAAAAGSYAITLSSASFVTDAPLQVGVYSISGHPASVLATRALRSVSGSYSLQATSAAFVVTAPIRVGSYTISGQSAAILARRVLPAQAGSYSVTGDNATLSLIQQGLQHLLVDGVAVEIGFSSAGAPLSSLLGVTPGFSDSPLPSPSRFVPIAVDPPLPHIAAIENFVPEVDVYRKLDAEGVLKDG